MTVKDRLLHQIIELGIKKENVRMHKATIQKRKVVKMKREKKRLDKAVQNHTELKLINTALAESRKVITLDSKVKVEIHAGDHSIFIIDEAGDKIPLPSGSYDYQDKVIVVEPEGTISAIKVKPVDKVNDAISKLKKYI